MELMGRHLCAAPRRSCLSYSYLRALIGLELATRQACPATVAQALIAGSQREVGPGAAVERYRELRKEFYGSHTYDFSELTLSMYADSIFRGKPDAGLALHTLNLEFHPESARAHLSLGAGYQFLGELEKAVEYYRKSLEINPDSRFAQGRLKAAEEALQAKESESKPE